MPWPSVYQTFDAAVVDVPSPCLAPVVQADAMPGAPGASAASVATGASTVRPRTTSAPATASDRLGMRGGACAGRRGLSRAVRGPSPSDPLQTAPTPLRP